MKEKFTVALIGCGAFAKFFVPLFKAHPYMEKFYVCDKIPEKAATFCEDFGVESIASFEEALARPDIDAVAVSYAEVASYVESGDLKVLAVMSDNRLDSIPDVPTCKECGYDAVLGTWRGLGVPKDTPQEVVDYLYEAFTAASESQEFVDFMNNSNNVIDILDGATFEQRIAKDLEVYTGLVNDLGLKVQ